VAASQAPSPVAAPSPVVDDPAGKGPVAVRVNGVPILQADVDAYAKVRTADPERSLAVLIEAEVVAQEAARNRFPAAPGLDRVALARSYLESVYSESTLCGNITATDVRSFYEMTYEPGWPVDVYKGLVVEVRCCPTTETPCTSAEAGKCLADNRPVLRELQALAGTWTSDVVPDLSALAARFPLLKGYDFGFVVWPGIPLEDQKRKKLFDPATLRAVIALRTGQVSQPVESSLGYHVFRLTRFRPAIEPDSPELVDAARARICKDRVENTRHRYVLELLKSAVVERSGAGGGGAPPAPRPGRGR